MYKGFQGTTGQRIVMTIVIYSVGHSITILVAMCIVLAGFLKKKKSKGFMNYFGSHVRAK